MTDQPDLDAIRTREQMREAIAASFEHGAMEMRERAALTMQHVLDTVAPVDQTAEAIRDLPIGTHRPGPVDQDYEGLRACIATALGLPADTRVEDLLTRIGELRFAPGANTGREPEA